MAGTSMDPDRFWATIDLFDWSQSGDDDAVMAAARRSLAAMSADDIERFDDLLARYLHALDTRDHARACYLGVADPDDGDDFISADDFLYSRCAVVANGRRTYEDILSDPTQMPRDVEFESLLYLAPDAYVDRTGQEYQHAPATEIESFTNTEGWPRSSEAKPGLFTDGSVPPGNRRPR